MRKRFAYKSDDQYQQITVDETFFKGVVCFVKLQNVAKPKYIENGKEKLCIIDNGYSLIEAYPDNGKYALTIMFDNRGKLIEWYFVMDADIFMDMSNFREYTYAPERVDAYFDKLQSQKDRVDFLIMNDENRLEKLP